jgi:UDP-2,3-diacylglucosamine pyrophosphatase LpxH
VAFSDVHIGWKPKSNQEGFERFIEEYLETHEIEHLVMLGDIFDFWIGSPDRILRENNHILKRINDLETTIHYVIGNHDYTIQRYFEKSERDRFNFTRNLVIRHGEETFRFIHGHQVFEEVIFRTLLYGGLCLGLCQVQSFLKQLYIILRELSPENPVEFLLRPSWERIRCKFDGVFVRMRKRSKLLKIIGEATEQLEKWVREVALSENGLTKLKKQEFLVYGHFHMPGLSRMKKCANTGCWIKGEHQMAHKGFKDHSYLIIENGKVELHGNGNSSFL